MRHLKHLAALSAVILAAAGCIYPFDPVVEGTDGRLVVEGDIHVGSVSDFSFSRVYPIGDEEITLSAPVVRGYIEGEDGTRVDSAPKPVNEYGNGQEYGSYSLRFDTTDLTSGQKYRLHFEEQSSGAVYESDWIEVCLAPVIDDLSYILDEGREEMNVALSMHCNGRSHFRWHYDEEWEYHARDWARHYFDPVSGTVKEYLDGENTYYCWSSFKSPQIKIFSTADQVDDRFVDLEFHRIHRSEQRIQVLYHITVYLEALDEEAYKYWNNIQVNSQNQGTIFSPHSEPDAGQHPLPQRPGRTGDRIHKRRRAGSGRHVLRQPCREILQGPVHLPDNQGRGGALQLLRVLPARICLVLYRRGHRQSDRLRLDFGFVRGLPEERRHEDQALALAEQPYLRNRG